MNKKSRKEYDFFKLFDRYVSETRRGKRKQKNHKRIKKETHRKYIYLRKQLEDFCTSENFHLRIIAANRLNQREYKSEQKYWENFYDKFTDYLYDKEKLYDNYVGLLMKLLRCFFNYLNMKGFSVGEFHKNFYAPNEEIQIIVLSTERLKFLIHNKEFENSLPHRLQKIKDIFVFGCTVALRVSDLMNLTPNNIEKINGNVYLRVQSKKTQTVTRVLLPQYAIDIIEKYSTKKSLLPCYHKVYINKYGKELMERAGWTETFVKIRQRRGLPITVYKDPVTKIHFRFCEMVASHLMRRTAITNMLYLGMREEIVRKISGHAPGSKEFYRYVSYAQSLMDSETKSIHEKMAIKETELV